MVDVTIFVALLAGIVSFLSPCVLPIIPGFLSYLAGVSLDGEDVKSKRWQIFINSLFFVLGFSVIFAVLGVVLSTLLSAVAFDAQIWLARIGGIIVIFFGLYLTGVFKLKFLERAHKINVKRKFKSRYLQSFVFGLAFAAGWTPCVGAALGAILGLAATSPGQAFPLLLFYALGLGLPFLVVGLFASGAANFFNKYAKQLKWVNIAFGIILIALGVLVFTRQLGAVANFDFVNNLLLK